MRVIRSFGQEPKHVDPLPRAQPGQPRANMTTVNLNAAYFPAVELLSALVTVEILVVGGLEAINGHTSTGVVFAFIAALNNFLTRSAAVAAVHHLPVRDGGVGQDLRTARRGARAVRRARSDRPNAGPRKPALRRRLVPLRVRRRGRWALRDLDLGWVRQLRWWGPPARASPRSPSSWPAFTTPPREPCWSTVRPAHKLIARS